jgi:predicted metal-dependent hydrolase
MNTPRTWLRVAAYMLVKPGMFRRIFWDYLRFFAPGFHPWHRDDRRLIAAIERQLALSCERKLTLRPPAPAA